MWPARRARGRPHVAFTSFGDICSTDYPSRTAAIAANCAAAGVPADFVQRTDQGTGYFVQTIFPFSIGGNTDAGPETSISKTPGLVYSPSYTERAVAPRSPAGAREGT